jgi:hypothetical protein
MISYGNTFEEIGYGFVSVKSTTNCPYSILLEVDPEYIYFDLELSKEKAIFSRESIKTKISPSRS